MKSQTQLDFISNQHLSISWWKLGVFQLFLSLIGLIFASQIDDDSWQILAVFLIISGISLLPFIYRAINRPAPVVVADHLFVLTIAYFVYFIFGALLLPMGTKEEVDFALSYYPINAHTALEVAIVNTFGFGLALIAGALAPRRLVLQLGNSALRIGNKIPLSVVIALFLIVGTYAYYHVLNFDFNPKPGEVMAGTWRSLTNLLLVSIILAGAYSGKGASIYRVLAICFTVIQVVVGFLMLNKSQALLPIVAISIGYGWRLGVRKIALPSIAALTIAFLLIASPVSSVRNTYGLDTYINLDTRIDVLWSLLSSPRTNSINNEYFPWARLCYTPAQAAGMMLYESGSGGYDFEKIGWVFLPRFLFPDKPIISSAGADLHYKISGYMNSSAGLGVFVDGYYNYGLIGVVFSSLIVGLILSCTTIFANLIIKKSALLWLPLALSGDYMAYRIDGFLVGDYIGPFSLLLYVLISATILSSAFKISKI